MSWAESVTVVACGIVVVVVDGSEDAGADVLYSIILGMARATQRSKFEVPDAVATNYR